MTSTGDPAFIVPSERSLPRQEPTFSPVGDLFAPFFDVVFYSPSTDVGEELDIAASALEANPATRAQAASLRAQAATARAAQAASQAVALGDVTSIGSSRVTLSTVAGGLASFSPEGPGSPLGQLVNYRSSLEVTMLSAAALQATLTLNPPYEAAIEIIDNKLIKFGSLMEIQWGYLALDGSGSPAVSDKGLFRITQPSIKFGQQTTITIGGFDILSSSLQTIDTRCQWLREKFPTDLDIVTEIIKKKGGGLKVDDARVGTESSLRKKKSGKGVTQSDDDWTFFRRLLRQNDVTWTQVKDTIVLEDEQRVSVAEPKYRLFWYGQPQNEYDVPMISFETNPIMSLFAGVPGSRGQRTICRDPETKEITVMDLDPGKTGVAQTGEANTATTNRGFKTDKAKTSQGNIAPFAELDAACSSGRFFTEPCNRPNREEETKRENREIRMFYNTRATAVCPGVPGLLPQQVVEVRNVGETFSGNYRVMKVVHSIGASYVVKLDLLRAAASNTKSQGDPASPDKANTASIDPDAPPGVEVEPTVQEES